LLLISAPDGGEWLTSGLNRFFAGKNCGTPRKGGWAKPRVSLEVLEKRKISFSYRDSNPSP